MDNKQTYALAQEMAEVFRAMGDVNRLIIINILASEEVDRVSVTDLAKMLRISQPAASQHLKILKNTGIIEAKREGNFKYYTFNREAMEASKKNLDLLFRLAFEKCERCPEG